MTANSARRRAREALFRILYQTEICQDPLIAAWEADEKQKDLPSEAREYAGELCQIIDQNREEIDARLRPCLKNWTFDRLASIDRSVLRMATAELAWMTGTPARVVLDEAIEIARRFGGPESGKFVNGILDQLARRVRPGELEEAQLDRSEQ